MQTFGQVWPNEWIQRFPQLQQIQIPTPTNNDDAFLWLGPNQVRQFFSVKVAWKTLEEIGPLHHWYKIVWNKAFIPKHALCMWMACLKRLPTQDRLNQWKNDPPDLKCVFCNMVIETHNHLFFECNYSGSIWNTIKQETGIQNSLNTWEDILLAWSMGTWRRWTTVQRLAISATVYHIWLERNRKFFDNHNRNISEVVADVKMEILMRMAWKTKLKQRSLNET